MTVIYPGVRLPVPSSGPPGTANGSDVSSFLFDLAFRGVYLAGPVTRPAGELLPHRFTLAGGKGITNYELRITGTVFALGNVYPVFN